MKKKRIPGTCCGAWAGRRISRHRSCAKKKHTIRFAISPATQPSKNHENRTRIHRDTGVSNETTTHTRVAKKKKKKKRKEKKSATQYL
jgi:CelD/BcsL family acetyltransferase involved in cellulose biosynthesis